MPTDRYAIVRVEPTPEMLDAGTDAIAEHIDSASHPGLPGVCAGECYAAMIAASSPVGEEVVDARLVATAMQAPVGDGLCVADFVDGDNPEHDERIIAAALKAALSHITGESDGR